MKGNAGRSSMRMERSDCRPSWGCEEDRLNGARQIAGNIGGSALTEVQRQSRVLDYFTCRLKIEQESQK